jgi:hypothetical protein
VGSVEYIRERPDQREALSRKISDRFDEAGRDFMKKNSIKLITLLGALGIASCQTAHEVAVGSFRVVDAPAAYIRRQIDSENGSTTTTTTTTTVDSTDTIPARTDVSTTAIRTAPASTAPSRSPHNETAASQTKTVPSPKTTGIQGQIPYAKPVPGKPGYVYSPFDSSGGYVDVTGFNPGSKVKDPYSGKIFLVP